MGIYPHSYFSSCLQPRCNVFRLEGSRTLERTDTNDPVVKLTLAMQGQHSLGSLCGHRHNLNGIKGERCLIVHSQFQVVKYLSFGLVMHSSRGFHKLFSETCSLFVDRGCTPTWDILYISSLGLAFVRKQ